MDRDHRPQVRGRVGDEHDLLVTALGHHLGDLHQGRAYVARRSVGSGARWIRSRRRHSPRSPTTTPVGTPPSATPSSRPSGSSPPSAPTSASPATSSPTSSRAGTWSSSSITTASCARSTTCAATGPGRSAPPSRGTRPHLVCGYHGWAYGLDGSLQRARDFGADLDVAGLRARCRCAVAEWRGLVFVPGRVRRPVADRCAGHVGRPLRRPVDRVAQRTATGSCTPSTRTGRRTPTTTARATTCRSCTPGCTVRSTHGSTASRCTTAGPSTPPLRATARSRRACGSGAHPNLGLNLSTEGMNVERWIPDGPRRTRIVYDFFFADCSSATEAARREVERFGVRGARRGPAHLRGGAAQPRVRRVRRGPAQPAPRERRARVPAAGPGGGRRADDPSAGSSSSASELTQ